MKKILCLSLCAALAVSMTGCGAGSPAGGASEVDTSAGSASEVGPSTGAETAPDASPVSPGLNIGEMFTDRDKETGYDTADSAVLTLDGAEIRCDSDSVEIDGAAATIRAAGTYILTGQLDNGQIIVDAGKSDKVQLVLDGAAVNCDTSAAIYVRQADKVFITLAAGSENTLSNTGDFAAIDDNNIDGVLFSKDDLTINGSGSLTINAACGHGVVSKDDLVITGGTYTIQSAGHGLSGKDSVRILDGIFVINSGKDGVHAENKDDDSLGYIYIAGGTYSITAQGDGFDAATVLQADDGSFTITAGGGSQNAAEREGNGGPGGWGGVGKRPGGGSASDSGRSDVGDTSGSGRSGGGGASGSGRSDGGDADSGGGRPGGGGRTGGRPGQNDADMPPVGGNGSSGESGNSSEEGSSGITPPSHSAPAGDSAATETPASDTPSTKGLKAGTLLLVQGGSFSINSADDALHSNGDLAVHNGSLALATGDDGMHADGALTVSGGTVDISTCYEGLEGQTIEISGGVISLTASDDGLNAAGGSDQSGFNGGPAPDNFAASDDGFIRITGGIIRIDASGDGIDSNGSLYVTGGEIYVDGPVGGGDSALDYDGEAVIEGGFIVAVGSRGMAQNFGEARNQGAIMVDLSQPQSAGTSVSLADSSGKELISYTPQKTYSNIVISCPGLAQSQTYELTAGTETISIAMDSLIYGTGGMGKRGGPR